jgi:hypothetical protein
LFSRRANNAERAFKIEQQINSLMAGSFYLYFGLLDEAFQSTRSSVM